MSITPAARRHVAPATSSSVGMLHEGSKGPQVLALQKALAAAGFNPHGLDGSFGPKTKAALIAFQRAAGITVDGLAGPQTWRALKAKAGTPTPSSPQPGPQTGPATGPQTGPVTGPTGPASKSIQSMLTWAKSMLGTPYAAVNPFRFGDVPWDGKAHKSVNGSSTVWQYPKGTRVFDCSGFVVAAYRQLGVDLAAKGLASTSTFNADTKFLKPLTREQLAPGDLIMYQPHNGIGHVVIYMGEGKAIEAAGGKGVSINNVDWDRIKSMRRVPLP
jgi:peptidoglycan endopeptidase LytE